MSKKQKWWRISTRKERRCERCGRKSGAASTSSWATAKSRSSGYSQSQGYSESEVPWYEYEEFQEASSIADRPLEEQLYRAMSIMRNQPTRDALIKIGKRKVAHARIARVAEPLVSERRVKEFEQACYSGSPFSLPSAEAQKVIEVRVKLLTQAKKEKLPDQPEPGSFRIPRKP